MLCVFGLRLSVMSGFRWIISGIALLTLYKVTYLQGTPDQQIATTAAMIPFFLSEFKHQHQALPQLRPTVSPETVVFTPHPGPAAYVPEAETDKVEKGEKSPVMKEAISAIGDGARRAKRMHSMREVTSSFKEKRKSHSPHENPGMLVNVRCAYL